MLLARAARGPHTRAHTRDLTLEQAHTFTHTRELCDVTATTHVPAYRLALRKSSLVSCVWCGRCVTVWGYVRHTRRAHGVASGFRV